MAGADGTDLNQQFVEIIERALFVHYHPDLKNQFTGKTDIHDKVSIQLGNRFGVIDRGIAGLIWELWRVEFHTIGCCEQYEHGDAYIQFPCAQFGADQFVSLCQQLGIAITVQKDKPRAGINLSCNGKSFGRIAFDSVTVRFAPAAIPLLTAELKKVNDQKRRAGGEGPTVDT